MTNDLPLEERKFQFEREKFEFEKTRTRGRNFFNDNIGVIVTAMIGTATVIVSVSQLLMTAENNRSLLELETRKATIAIEHENRRIQAELAKTLLDSADEFSTTDTQQIGFLYEVVVGVMPSDVGSKIARRMANNARNPDMRSAWSDAQVILSVDATGVVETNGSPITVDSVVAAFPQLADAEPRKRVEALLSAAADAGIAGEGVAIFLAMTFQQTNFLRNTQVNLNYSASRLRQVFPSRFATEDSADAAAGDEEQIAEIIYGGRLGNTVPGDGWKYRGRGYFMTTGRANYEELGALIGVDLVADPDQLSDPEVAAKAAAMQFGRLPDTSSVTTAYRRINGGMAGVSDLQAIYQALSPTAPKLVDSPTTPQETAASKG